MVSRGPALILAAVCLVAAPAAVKVLSERQEATAGPAEIQTRSAERAACDSAAIDTAIGRLGCQGQPKVRETRRTDSSGALFVSVGGS